MIVSQRPRSNPICRQLWTSGGLMLLSLLVAGCDQATELVDQASKDIQEKVDSASSSTSTESSSTQDTASGVQTTPTTEGNTSTESGSATDVVTPAPTATPTISPTPETPEQTIQRILGVQREYLADNHIAQLASLGEHVELITTMNLARSKVTDSGISYLPKFTKLDSLDAGSLQLTAAGIEQIGKIETLEQLSLAFVPVTDDMLESLTGLTNLRVLNLTSTRITDAGFEHLAKLPALDTLIVNSTQIDGSGLAHLNERIEEFKYISVDRTRLRDDAIVHLKGAASIEALSAVGCFITDEGLKVLGSLGTLKQLYLSENQLSFQAGAQLRRLRNLEELSLDFMPVNDFTLSQLTVLKKLKHLSVAKTSCTEQGLAAFKKAVPNVEIYYMK